MVSSCPLEDSASSHLTHHLYDQLSSSENDQEETYLHQRLAICQTGECIGSLRELEGIEVGQQGLLLRARHLESTQFFPRWRPRVFLIPVDVTSAFIL